MALSGGFIEKPSFSVHLWVFYLLSGPAGENGVSDHLVKKQHTLLNNMIVEESFKSGAQKAAGLSFLPSSYSNSALKQQYSTHSPHCRSSRGALRTAVRV